MIYFTCNHHLSFLRYVTELYMTSIGDMSSWGGWGEGKVSSFCFTTSILPVYKLTQPFFSLVFDHSFGVKGSFVWKVVTNTSADSR